MVDQVVELKDVNHIHPLDNFVQGGIDYLPSEVFQDKEKFIKMLSIILDRLKYVDEQMVKLAELRLLNQAEGVNLDEIGEQMGIYRNGLNDTEFRAIIMIFAGGNSKSGTRSEIIGTLAQLFGTDGFSTYKGLNYRFDINIFNTCVDLAEILPEIIEMLPLVTHLRVTDHSGYPFGFEGDARAFGFGSVHDPVRTGAGGVASLVYVSDDEDPMA